MTLGANQIAAYAADLLDIDEQIEALQDGKRDTYKAIRDEHGKSEATALKLAVKLSRMDSEKRDEAEAVDAEAQRMLAIIETAGRAPRATRVETTEEFRSRHIEMVREERGALGLPRAIAVAYDPITGEVIETEADTNSTAPLNQPPAVQSGGPDGGVVQSSPAVDLDSTASVTVATAGVAVDTAEEVGAPASSAVTDPAFHAADPDKSGGEVQASSPAPSNVVPMQSAWDGPRNSAGVKRLHGCLNLDQCASQHATRQLCDGCRRALPVEPGGVAVQHQGAVS